MLCRFALAQAAKAFHFFSTKKRNETKKIRRLRSGAKKSTYFPKRKELASLKQLFVLNGKYSIFLHAPPLRPEANFFVQHRFARWGVMFFAFASHYNGEVKTP